MSHDLFLGFKEEPEDIVSVLTNLGFEPDGRRHKFYDSQNSHCPIFFQYSADLEDPKFWHSVDPLVVAEGSLTCYGGSQFDFDKHLEFGRFLRDYYNATLIDSHQSSDFVIRD